MSDRRLIWWTDDNLGKPFASSGQVQSILALRAALKQGISRGKLVYNPKGLNFVLNSLYNTTARGRVNILQAALRKDPYGVTQGQIGLP
jgi:hypothetical protein